MRSFREQYGARAEEVFFAAKNAGTITGVDTDEDKILGPASAAKISDLWREHLGGER